MTGEIMTVQVLNLAGFEEMDHQQHQINDFIVHLDIIKITLQIQNIELLDKVMAIGQQMRSVMMAMIMMEMDAVRFETLSMIMCVKAAQAIQQMSELSAIRCIELIMQKINVN